MKRVLVTGAAGFLGRHCLPALHARNYEVHAVSSKAVTDVDLLLPGVRWHNADLLRADCVSDLLAQVQPTHLLHFAWYAVPGEYWTATENLHWVAASLNLVEAFASCGGRRAVVAGSCAEYDWQDGYCSEQTTLLRPATLYGACKHGLQIMLDAFARQASLSAAWGRIFFLYGAHEHPKRLIASVIRSALQNEPVRCSHGNQIRDFLYVKDAAEAFVALLESEVTGAVNIASGNAIALKEVICLAAEKLGRLDSVQLGALPASANEPPVLLADVRRLRNEVGWSPQYGLDRGLDETIEWWKNHPYMSRENDR